MSRTPKTKNNLVQLSEEKQVPRTLRKGLPDEYKELLAKGKVDYDIMIDEQKEKAARLYVPKLYAILIKYDYPPKTAGKIITTDCAKMWSMGHISKHIPDPDKTKEPDKRKAGQISSKVRNQKRKVELEQFVEEVKDVVPGLANASPEVRKAVSKLGGETLRDLYGSEHFSEMGKKGGYPKHKTQQLFELTIEGEEHKEIVKAWEDSLIARGNGTGGYTIFVKDGEFDHAKPSDGNAEKTVNK